MGAIRLLGTPTKLTGSRQIALTVTLSSPGSTVLSGPTDATYLTVGASGNVFQPIHYANKVVRQIRQWLFSAMGPEPNVAPPGAVTSVPTTVTLSLAETVNGTRFVLTLGLNSTPAGTISQVQLDNTSGWATPLGLAQDGVTRTINVSGTSVEITGEFQPRTIWTFPDTTVDSGDYRVKGQEVTNVDGNGTVHFADVGGYYYRRDFALVDLSADFGGPSFPIGLFDSWVTSARRSLNLYLPDETVFTGMSGAFERLEDVSVGDYLTIGNINWCSRVKAVNSTSIDLWEPFPANVTANQGDEIRIVSDARAFEIELKRLAMCHIWDMNDEAGVPYYGRFGTYGPFSSGETEEIEERPSNDDPLYNKQLNLARYAKNPLTLP